MPVRINLVCSVLILGTCFLDPTRSTAYTAMLGAGSAAVGADDLAGSAAPAAHLHVMRTGHLVGLVVLLELVGGEELVAPQIHVRSLEEAPGVDASAPVGVLLVAYAAAIVLGAEIHLIDRAQFVFLKGYLVAVILVRMALTLCRIGIHQVPNPFARRIVDGQHLPSDIFVFHGSCYSGLMKKALMTLVVKMITNATSTIRK